MDLFEFAEALRDRGMGRAADAQDAACPEFADEALDAIKRVARRQQKLFVDDVTAECRIKPGHYNAWGAVWMRAIKAGFIEATSERRRSRDPKKHAHDYKVYRSLIHRPTH